MIENLALQHAEIATLVVPPPPFRRLDELVIRRRVRVRARSLTLGAQATVPLVLRSEVPVVCVTAAATGTVLLLLAGLTGAQPAGPPMGQGSPPTAH